MKKMKTKRSFSTTLKFLALACFAVFLLYFPGCDITDPAEGIKAIMNTKERTTTVAVILRDAATNEPVGFDNNNKVRVTIEGKDKDKVIDLVNRKKTEFESVKGFISFAFLDDVVPDINNPLEIIIIAEADGFITTSLPLTITIPENNPVEIMMVNTSSPPEGVVGEVNQPIGSTSSTGHATSDIQFGTGRDPITNTRASFFIRNDTRITTSTGNPLQGQLRATYHLFNSRSPESLQSFPGGFSVQADDSPNGEDRVFFTTGGFTSIQITDQAGNRAVNFDPPIQVGIELDQQVRDHNNNPVNSGDMVPIWSYDETSGSWTFERNAPIRDGGSGNLEVQFEASHLSWWNIDWFSNACYEGTRVNLLGNNSQLRGRLIRADNMTLLGWMASRYLYDSANFIQFIWAPRGIPGILELYNMSEELLATVELPNLCSTTPVDVNLQSSTEITVTFRGTGLCPDKVEDVQIRPNFPAFYKPASSGVWLSAGNVVNGEIQITFPAPGMYNFGAYYENEWYQFSLDLSNAQDGDVYDETFDLPQVICDEIK